MDCDTISTGDDGRHPVVARVTIVNFRGHILLDTYVQPKAEVTDYRTVDHGITAAHLENAPDFETVQQEVAALLKDRVLVGHELGRQLKLFQHSHPPQLRRDTSSYRDIVALVPGETRPTLKQLAATLFGITINKKQNSTAEAATMAMLLFRKFKKQWESFEGRKKTLSTKKSK
ncbi:3'-5' exonuclease [Tieghemiomyces parasiticus]|uniref:3'-5' exonuclease n=1 Tax=Tieghemiomyces parasiticus TaxID=78921 RepID=A0A9W8AF43_9FUNG|nr:3'-5' exonuclease [Tieghemiomyces parasiticus]